MEKDYTPFSDVYNSFLSKITDDMYMELTEQDTFKLLYQLLLSAIVKFEFPRQHLDYEFKQEEGEWAFINLLTNEEINIIATYMIV